MDWPEELLEIFDDPLLADVRPKPKAPTPDDRLAPVSYTHLDVYKRQPLQHAPDQRF